MFVMRMRQLIIFSGFYINIVNIQYYLIMCGEIMIVYFFFILIINNKLFNDFLEVLLNI